MTTFTIEAKTVHAHIEACVTVNGQRVGDVCLSPLELSVQIDRLQLELERLRKQVCKSYGRDDRDFPSTSRMVAELRRRLADVAAKE